MSWQAYVDDQLMSTKMVTHAVICGHDGNIWAQSAGFTVTPEELKGLIAKFGNTDQMAQSGINVAGTKYMYLSSTDKVIRAKKGTSGVHVIKTTQIHTQRFNKLTVLKTNLFCSPALFLWVSYIVCVYKEPIVPEQAASVTEKLGEYLIQVGF
eukprot:08933.XXX_327506_324270_1 [CDS] Oithona nana genome sequencing.